MNPYELLVELRENKVLYQFFETGAVILKDNGDWMLSGESDTGEARVHELATGVLRISLPLYVDKELPLPALEKIILSMQENMEGILMVEFVEGFPQGSYVIHTTLEGLDEGLRKFVEESRDFKSTIKNVLKTVEEMKASMADEIKDKLMGSMKQGGVSPKHLGPKRDLEENTSVWNAVGEVDKTQFPPLEPEEDDLSLYLDDEVDMNPPRPLDDDPWDEFNPPPDETKGNDPGPWVD